MYKIIETTTDSITNAKLIANYLIKNKMSKCVQIIKNELSVYDWKKKIHNSSEYILKIKLNAINENKISKYISSANKYDIPEIISYDINILNDSYKKWLDY